MRIFTIKHVRNKKTLYEKQASCFKSCLEQAIEKNICLNYADLRNQNLTGAMLNSARLAHANFTNSNLTGANLSEADLRGAQFMNATLYDTCLAYSNLRCSSFEGAFFGATDITGADISEARFSTLSCFTLDFIHAAAMNKCIFKNPDGSLSPMSHPPIVIKGLPKTIVFLEQHIKVEHEVLDHAEWIAMMKKETKETARKTAIYS